MNTYFFRYLKEFNIDSKELFYDIIDEVYSETSSKEILEFMGQSQPEMPMDQLMQLLQKNIEQDPGLKQKIGDKFNQINQILVQAKQDPNSQQMKSNPTGRSVLNQTRQWGGQTNNNANLGNQQSQFGSQNNNTYRNTNYNNPNYRKS